MSFQFKLNLVISKIIAFLGVLSILTIILELLKILPREIMSYLVGFSFVVSPILFISSLINYILILFITKYNYEKNYFNMKWSIGLTFIGLMPFMFYFIMILTFGF
ncbi:hypothetical protein ACNULB_04180 [Clostridium perfringens]|uniref:hypothetical protein n=1 Tax=Clostridium perfringens TaxID=1502 RepID=UPI003AFF6128